MRDYASLYQDLLEDLALPCDQTAPITCDMDARMVAKLTLAGSFYKKLSPTGSSGTADAKALSKFLAVNSALPSDGFDFHVESELESLFFDYFRGHLNRALEAGGIHDFDYRYIGEHMGVGPGASQKADSTWFHSKVFESPLSYTDDELIYIYRAALSHTGSWAEAEMHRFQRFGFERVRGGKLFFVKKNSEISRTCCTEPGLNMLIQKACEALLINCLRVYFGINLSTQADTNRELARQGSIDGRYCTIDLVSASDSNGRHMINRSIEGNTLFKRCLNWSSCKLVELPNGELCKLNMISTMGNGFTFPLQTLIFASAARACYDLMDIKVGPDAKLSVFGDDIIVRNDVYELLTRMLTKLGYGVNVAKSFNAGPFRESCGTDWYRGTNVRGVYITTLETPESVYSAINRLLRWSAVHGVYLNKVIRKLRSWVRHLPVPFEASDISGIKVPSGLRTRRTSRIHGFETYKCLVPITKSYHVPVDDDGNLIPWNISGILVTLVGGYARTPDSSFQPKGRYSGPAYSPRRGRGEKIRSRISSRLIPFWDHFPLTWCDPLKEDGALVSRAFTSLSYDSWERVVTGHLFSE